MKSSRRIMIVAIGIAMALVISTNNLAAESTAAQQVSAQPAAVATQAIVEADTIVVSATRIPQSIRDLGVSVSVVPRERIEELQAQNVGEVLQEVTDARVNSYGSMGAGSGITLRGSSAQQVLVMVDGRPVNVASVGMADLSM